MSNYRSTYELGGSGPLGSASMQGYKDNKKRQNDSTYKAMHIKKSKLANTLPEDPDDYYQNKAGHGWEDRIAKGNRKDMKKPKTKLLEDDPVLELASRLYLSQAEVDAEETPESNEEVIRELRRINDPVNFVSMLNTDSLRRKALEDKHLEQVAVEEYVRVRGSKATWSHMEASNHPSFITNYASSLKRHLNDISESNLLYIYIYISLASRAQWPDISVHLSQLNRVSLSTNLNQRKVQVSDDIYIYKNKVDPATPTLEVNKHEISNESKEQPYVISTTILGEVLLRTLVLRSQKLDEPDMVTLNSNEIEFALTLMKSIEKRGYEHFGLASISIGLLYRLAIAIVALGSRVKGTLYIKIIGDNLVKKQRQLPQDCWPRIVILFTNIGVPLHGV